MKATNKSLTNRLDGRLFRRSKSVLVASELQTSGRGNADKNTAYQLLSSSTSSARLTSSPQHDYGRRGNSVWVMFKKVFAFKKRKGGGGGGGGGDEAISNRRVPGEDIHDINITSSSSQQRKLATEKDKKKEDDHGHGIGTRINNNQLIWIPGPYSRWPVHGRRPSVRRSNSTRT